MVLYRHWFESLEVGCPKAWPSQEDYSEIWGYAPNFVYILRRRQVSVEYLVLPMTR
jgi:hypothetical protein